ncbi:tRNA uridine-5-carboxymethylaminomethyl(34) synthesis GTPase MnmE, partial [Parabacteroides distasonis]
GMKQTTEPTIAAISTGQSPGGIGIVRISGPAARAIADQVFSAKSGKRIADAKGYTALYGHVHDRENNVLDEAIALVFAAPASFTGEDVVELSCHGGLVILKNVLRA